MSIPIQYREICEPRIESVGMSRKFYPSDKIYTVELPGFNNEISLPRIQTPVLAQLVLCDRLNIRQLDLNHFATVF